MQASVNFGKVCYLHNHMDNYFVEQTNLELSLFMQYFTPSNLALLLPDSLVSVRVFEEMMEREMVEKRMYKHLDCSCNSPSLPSKKEKILYFQYRNCSFPSVRPWNFKEEEEKLPFSSQ